MKSIVQLICAAVMGVGIGVEVALGGHIGYVLITSGSLALFLVTKFMRR